MNLKTGRNVHVVFVALVIYERGSEKLLEHFYQKISGGGPRNGTTLTF